MTKIINRKVITITHDLNSHGGGNPREWDEPINVQFQPDQMVIKQIVCNGDPAAPIASTCTLVNRTMNESFGAFYNNSCVSYPNIIFDRPMIPVNTNHHFMVLNSDRTRNTTFNGVMAITIELTQLSSQ